jgi:hypothetical protein
LFLEFLLERDGGATSVEPASLASLGFEGCFRFLFFLALA